MKRRLLAIPILALFASFLFGTHYYVVQRMIVAAGWSPAVTSFSTTLVVVLGMTMLLAPISERLLDVRYARWLVWPSSIWMGVGWLLLVALFASDLLVLLLAAYSSPEQQIGLARGRAWLVLLFVIPAAVVGLANGLAPPAVNRVRVGIARWPKTLRRLRIVQISDIHIGALRGAEFARSLVDRVNALDPDVIAVTGDLVDGRVEHLRDEVAPFGDLRAPMGVYFVTGNHDHYSGGSEWVQEISALGLTVLRNSHVTLDVSGHPIELLGVDDHRSNFMAGEPGEDLDAALAGVAPDRPVILLAHDPLTFKQASKQGVDLQISGHTHGGQIWPFRWMVRLAMPWVAGLYRVDDAQIWVSCGTGSWGPPMRLGAPAEITELSIGPDYSRR